MPSQLSDDEMSIVTVKGRDLGDPEGFVSWSLSSVVS